MFGKLLGDPGIDGTAYGMRSSIRDWYAETSVVRTFGPAGPAARSHGRLGEVQRQRQGSRCSCGWARSNMRLSHFRRKLLAEVTAAQALDGTSDQPFQPHLYCIAVLLRKIITRMGDSTRIKVTILPFNGGFTEQEETLGFLSSRILHSSEFRIVQGLCTIVSDHDVKRIRARFINTDDFLDAAKLIASDHEAVLEPLIRHTLTTVYRLVQGGGDGAEVLAAKRLADQGLEVEAQEVEALESVSDVFDLARMSSKARNLHGRLALWVVPSGAEEIQRLQRGEEPSLRPRQTSYSALVDNLFRTWVPFPLRQWRVHRPLGAGLDFHGERDEWWFLAVDDLLAFLEAARDQWFGANQ